VGDAVYKPGQHVWQKWNSAPAGPSFGPPEEPKWGAYRVGNQLRIFLTPFSPGEKEHALIAFGGTTTLSRDGKIIGTANQAAFGQFNVPADAGTYTLSATGTHQVSWSDLGTALDASWTFQSVPAADTTPHFLPLLLVHVSAPLDDYDTALAGLPFLLSLEVQRQAAAPASPVTDLQLEVSYDDGQTWQQAPVAFLGDRGVALLFHPTTPGFVSLRTSAQDAAGNSVTHTITRAYKIGTSVQYQFASRND
jgi:hypothetical protein